MGIMPDRFNSTSAPDIEQIGAMVSLQQTARETGCVPVGTMITYACVNCGAAVAFPGLHVQHCPASGKFELKDEGFDLPGECEQLPRWKTESTSPRVPFSRPPRKSV